MKGTEKIVLVWVALLFAISLCTLLSPFIPWSAHRVLHSATAAAWAQTAGTVLAMMSGAGAIAWQVRFESRREARRDLKLQLDAAVEIRDLVGAAAGQITPLLFMLGPEGEPAALERMLQQEDFELRWYEINSTFEGMDFPAIPGARLKLAFLRAKNGFSKGFNAHGQAYQHVFSAPRDVAPIKRELEQATDHLRVAHLQIDVVVQMLWQQIATV